LPGQFELYGTTFSVKSRYTVKQRQDLLTLMPTQEVVKSILELGCADGTNLKFFADSLGISLDSCIGVDICQSYEQAHFDFNFKHMAIEDFLNDSSRCFDLILMSDVLEHLYNPWKILAGLKKHLSPNGLLLVSVPNFQNLNYLHAVNSGTFFYKDTGLFDETHIRFFSINVLSQYLIEAGYKIVKSSWRPDLSLASMKVDLLERLSPGVSAELNIGNMTLHIDQNNIEQYFGQQILIGARNG
jgi:O-antigen biosynthesis protein